MVTRIIRIIGGTIVICLGLMGLVLDSVVYARLAVIVIGLLVLISAYCDHTKD